LPKAGDDLKCRLATELIGDRYGDASDSLFFGGR
jgi:hypothetical protein